MKDSYSREINYLKISLTDKCNLSCVYCYQNHDSNDMSFETAKTCIDWIFDNVPKVLMKSKLVLLVENL